MSVEAKAEAISENMYIKLNDSTEAEAEKKLRYVEEKYKIHQRTNRQKPDNKKTGFQQMPGTQIVQTT